ncbi:MAG TPA: DegQ family serine endoprotease [Blastocatellia bacterium]|nr:DegQ family serine endoprotease [Blastocatellia bacterium]
METGIDHIINVGRRLQRPNWTILSLVAAVVLIAGAVFGSAATARGWFNGGGEKVPIYVSSDPKINDQVTINGGFAAIAKAVTPAVVTIKISSRRSRQQEVPFMFDPFRDFFDRQSPDDEGTPRRRSPREQKGQGRLVPTGVGSGVIVSPDGYILTNNHVVDEADKVEVELNDNRKFTAKVIGTDSPSDVAVIKIDATGLPTVPLGDSDRVEVGDLVLAVGNPLGVGQTVTMGIISAKGRQTPGRDQSAVEDFLQTDAAINQGNSGGALVNLRGELIGVPSQILSRSGGNIGIGFAIPTKMARNVMDQLVRNGKVRRGRLGVTIRDIEPEMAKQFGYNGANGALVDEVEKGLAADQAGVKAGDIITEFQGQRITDSSQLRNSALQTTPGTTVKFKVWRAGAERELSAKLGEFDLDNDSSKKLKSEPVVSSLGVLSGVSVENISPEWAERLKLQPSARGVVITEVDPDSNAAAAGLRPGVVIAEVAKQPVANVTEFNAAVQKADKKEVLLRVRRLVNGRSSGSFVIVKAEE